MIACVAEPVWLVVPADPVPADAVMPIVALAAALAVTVPALPVPDPPVMEVVASMAGLMTIVSATHPSVVAVVLPVNAAGS